MKNQSFKTVKRAPHFQKNVAQEMHSEVVEEILNMTFPNYSKLFAYKKKALYQVIFSYFFSGDESKFYEIETYSNVVTACHLKGYCWMIQKNNLQSFAEFDELMSTRKKKSFHRLNQSLRQHELLGEEEKNKILGGKKSKWFSVNIFIFSKKLLTA